GAAAGADADTAHAGRDDDALEGRSVGVVRARQPRQHDRLRPVVRDRGHGPDTRRNEAESADLERPLGAKRLRLERGRHQYERSTVCQLISTMRSIARRACDATSSGTVTWWRRSRRLSRSFGSVICFMYRQTARSDIA